MTGPDHRRPDHRGLGHRRRPAGPVPEQRPLPAARPARAGWTQRGVAGPRHPPRPPGGDQDPAGRRRRRLGRAHRARGQDPRADRPPARRPDLRLVRRTGQAVDRHAVHPRPHPRRHPGHRRPAARGQVVGRGPGAEQRAGREPPGGDRPPRPQARQRDDRPATTPSGWSTSASPCADRPARSRRRGRPSARSRTWRRSHCPDTPTGPPTCGASASCCSPWPPAPTRSSGRTRWPPPARSCTRPSRICRCRRCRTVGRRLLQRNPGPPAHRRPAGRRAAHRDAGPDRPGPDRRGRRPRVVPAALAAAGANRGPRGVPTGADPRRPRPPCPPPAPTRSWPTRRRSPSRPAPTPADPSPAVAPSPLAPSPLAQSGMAYWGMSRVIDPALERAAPPQPDRWPPSRRSRPRRRRWSRPAPDPRAEPPAGRRRPVPRHRRCASAPTVGRRPPPSGTRPRSPCRCSAAGRNRRWPRSPGSGSACCASCPRTCRCRTWPVLLACVAGAVAAACLSAGRPHASSGPGLTITVGWAVLLSVGMTTAGQLGPVAVGVAAGAVALLTLAAAVGVRRICSATAPDPRTEASGTSLECGVHRDRARGRTRRRRRTGRRQRRPRPLRPAGRDRRRPVGDLGGRPGRCCGRTRAWPYPGCPTSWSSAPG